MATYFKILGQVAPTPSVANTIYQVASGRQAVISTINICNLDSITRTFRIAAVANNGTISANNYLAYETPIQASDSVAMSIGVTLQGNDYISVFANNTSNVAFSIFGSEIY